MYKNTLVNWSIQQTTIHYIPLSLEQSQLIVFAWPYPFLHAPWVELTWTCLPLARE